MTATRSTPRLPVPCAECGKPVPQPQGRGRTAIRCPGECARKAQARNLYVFRCGTPEERAAHVEAARILRERASNLRRLEVLNARLDRLNLTMQAIATLTRERDALAQELAAGASQ